ncbi:minor capsid protein [Streptococcus hyovaginalis]|uniref:minor capsid protein n=1 Tax=Streptococcus hyovaginalis TaxID=149015 RepID=UPI00147944AF|nr:minor capsid protein [Streptococcus hyovaginalis]
MAKTHLDYWQKRMDEILRHVDQTDFDFFAELTKLYADESAQIQKELYSFYGRYADENGLTYEQAMERLRKEDLSDYQANAKKYFEQAKKDPELLKRLNEQYTSAKATRLEMLNLELTYRIGLLNGKLQGSFGSYLKGVAGYAYRKTMGGNAVGINTPAIEELARTPINGHNYSEDLWKHTDNLAKDLKETLRRGFIRGENPRAMAQAIASKYNVARSRAQTLIRTDGTAVIANSVARRYQDAGLKYYRILVHLDERTTEICRSIAREDKRYELSEFKAGVTAPPFHYNCRSGIIPDDKELDDEGIEETQEKEYDADYFKADLNYIRQSSYVDKFRKNKLTSPIAEQLASISRKMIQHRTGTPFEDYYLLEADTGKVVALSNKARKTKGVVYNEQIRDAFKSYGKQTLISIHNHPSGYPPSLSDLASLQQRSKNNTVKYGLTVGHDGSIYWYSKPNKRIPKEIVLQYFNQIDKFKKMGYNEVVAQEKTLELFSELFDFKFGRID